LAGDRITVTSNIVGLGVREGYRLTRMDSL
jgi:hypothetical protein